MSDALKRASIEAAKRFLDVFRPLQEEFETALAACPDASDTSPEAEAARERVRRALYAASCEDPNSELARAKADCERLERALIAAGCADM
jgi:hypothetical protein